MLVTASHCVRHASFDVLSTIWLYNKEEESFYDEGTQ